MLPVIMTSWRPASYLQRLGEDRDHTHSHASRSCIHLTQTYRSLNIVVGSSRLRIQGRYEPVDILNGPGLAVMVFGPVLVGRQLNVKGTFVNGSQPLGLGAPQRTSDS